MKQAIFPGSFDPFTSGHMDVLKLALELFDSITIAVGYNSNKKGFFDSETRVAIIKEIIKDIPNVNVCKYNKLTIDLCKDLDIKHIIRGVRTAGDFEFESNIAQANKSIAPEISTIFIPASGENSFISSTMVRDLIIHGADASRFMPNKLDITKFCK